MIHAPSRYVTYVTMKLPRVTLLILFAKSVRPFTSWMGLEVSLPVLGMCLVAVVGPTAGAGVSRHRDGRPSLGGMPAGKSERELRHLDPVVENGDRGASASTAKETRS